MSTSAKKDTIYIDVDDEITSIIDKLEGSKQSIVALVLPKRAATFQSIVNMRLLKRAADTAKKKVVLITNEAGILPLAGAVGVHVAKNLTSKPAVPLAPELTSTDSDIEDGDIEAATEDADIDPNKSIGELSGQPVDEPEETIELEDETAVAATAERAAKPAKVKKDSKLKIPNFDKFRVLLALGILGVILLIGGTIFAMKVLPKATVTIKTDSVDVTATLDVNTSDKIQTVDEAQNLVPSSLQEQKESTTEKVPATGQKDLGTRASGTVRLFNCDEDDKTLTISSGTFVSTGGLNYVTQAAATIGPSNFTGGGVCKKDSFKDVQVAAQNPGAQYNIDGGEVFSVSGAGGSVTGSNPGALSGGTTKIAKVVSAQDVETAKQRIATRLAGQQEKFQQKLEENGFYVLPETTTSTEPKIVSTPNVGQEATEVTVLQEVTYTALTVDKDGLNKLLKKALEKQIDTKKQKIANDDVLENATIRVGAKRSPTEVTIQLEKTDKAVPVFDKAAVAKELVGKKKGEIESLLGSRPGVKSVEVEMGPFWVSKAPKADKITIIDQPSDGN